MSHENLAEDLACKAEVAPPLDLEALRQKGSLEFQAKSESNKANVLQRVDQLIIFLQANREHLGGLVVTAIPIEGTVLVDPKENDTCDGIAAKTCLHNGYGNILAMRTKELLDRPTSGAAGFLGALLGR